MMVLPVHRQTTSMLATKPAAAPAAAAVEPGAQQASSPLRHKAPVGGAVRACQAFSSLLASTFSIHFSLRVFVCFRRIK